MHQLLIKQTPSDLWFSPSNQTLADGRLLRLAVRNGSWLQLLAAMLTTASRS